MKNLLVLLNIICFFIPFQAQIQVRSCDNATFLPEDLIKNIFLGDGVKVLNIKYEGAEKSVGLFSNGAAAISLNRGIIMTTGSASDAALPNSININSSTGSGTTLKDQQLSSAINSDQLSDISRFEITFIPFFDTISFNYVFASEEYPAYSCDVYNDVFGFFISGENPDGGMYNYQNIALIPGTDQVVSINNVHPSFQTNCQSKNSQFYNDNPIGNSAMVYNGYLDVLNAGAKVVPCTEYKIKLAIADVSDNLFDSAVFLEAKSFNSEGLKVEVKTPSFDNTISEACKSAQLNFSFNKAVKEDYNLELKVLDVQTTLNKAIETLDYNSFPQNAKILKGSKSFSFDINAFEDNIDETTEYIAFEYRKDLCNLDTIKIYISDNKLTDIVMQDTVKKCVDGIINVDAKLPVNLNPEKDKYFRSKKLFTLSGIKGSSMYCPLDINGITPEFLDLKMIKEICIDTLYGKDLQDIDIYLLSPSGKYLELSSDNFNRPTGPVIVDTLKNTCFSITASKAINNGNVIEGPYFPLNPNVTGNFKPEGEWNDLHNSIVNGTWQLFLYRDEGGFSANLESWHLAFNTNYSLYYDWNPKSNISCTDCLSPDIFPDYDNFYFLKTIDTYGCQSKDSIFAEINKMEILGQINCDSISTDYIRFKWHSTEIFPEFEFKIGESPDWIKTSKDYFSLNGLGFSEKIRISVRVYDESCHNPEITKICQTLPCPSPQIKVLNKKDLSCNGNSSGQIEIEAFGTKPPYSYEFHGIQYTTCKLTGLSSNEDTIFITDGAGCVIPYVFKLNEPPPIILNTNLNNISCYGFKDGSIDLNTTGGTAPYKYNWYYNNSSISYNGSKLKNLSSGNYHVEVSDTKNCIYKDTFIVTEPPLLSATESVYNVECKGYHTGKLLILPFGGIPPYTYHWTSQFGVSDQKDLVNIPAGLYNLELKDANNCSTNLSFKITEPEKGLEFSYIAKDTICRGNSDGAITLQIQNVENYDIRWNNGNSGVNLSNLNPGKYIVTITDDNTCIYTKEFNVVELNEVNILIDQEGASCHDLEDGKAWVSKVLYGQRETNKNDFKFSWDTPDFQNGLYAYYLKGGNVYTVTGIDKFNCINKASVAIDNPKVLQTKLVHLKNISCYGATDGLIEVNSPDCPDCIFKWSENTGSIDSKIAKNLRSGIYKITVTDPKGCFVESSFSLTEPPPIVVSAKTTDVKCFDGNDGTIEIKLTGGTPPFSMFLNDSLITNNLDQLEKGIYEIKIFDINNCSSIDSVIINQPLLPLSSIAESVDNVCKNGNDGKIFFEAYGGTPPYSYSLDNKKFYAINEFQGLESGFYKGFVSDLNGCLFIVDKISIGDGNIINVDLGPDTIVEANSIISIIPEVTNAAEPLSYVWTVPDGINISCTDCPNPEVETSFNFELILSVSDGNGCTNYDSKYIRVGVNDYIFVPNAINPKSSTFENSQLFVYGKNGIKIKDFIIYNSWNAEIFKKSNFFTNDETNGWNGTFNGQMMDTGIYAWYLLIELPDGTEKVLKGFVTLL